MKTRKSVFDNGWICIRPVDDGEQQKIKGMGRSALLLHRLAESVPEGGLQFFLFEAKV